MISPYTTFDNSSDPSASDRYRFLRGGHLSKTGNKWLADALLKYLRDKRVYSAD